MLKKIWDFKVARFVSVGVFNTLFDLAMLNTLVFFGHLPVVAANLISASISISSSYFLNHHVVFKSDENHSFKRFIHFFLVTGVGILGIQSLVIYTVTHLLGHNGQIVANLLRDLQIRHLSVKAFNLNVGKILAVLVAMSWNFMIYHLIIFKKANQEPDVDILI